MEHAGNIAYKAESVLLDESATQEELLARANVIAHETAHMWFGNLVTMRWFDDVWTKEVFANFIADKVIVPQFPQVRHDLQFFLAHYCDRLLRRPLGRCEPDPSAVGQPRATQAACTATSSTKSRRW